MKTAKSNRITILAAGAAMALTGTMLTGTAGAEHAESRRGSNSMSRTVRTLDVLTDRMHLLAKRELRHGRDARRTFALICELENRADRLRSGVDNRIPAPALHRLARSVEQCARSVAFRLRQTHASCELSELAAATLSEASSVVEPNVERRWSYRRFDRGWGDGRIDRENRFNSDRGYANAIARRNARSR